MSDRTQHMKLVGNEAFQLLDAIRHPGGHFFIVPKAVPQSDTLPPPTKSRLPPTKSRLPPTKSRQPPPTKSRQPPPMAVLDSDQAAMIYGGFIASTREVSRRGFKI